MVRWQPLGSLRALSEELEVGAVDVEVLERAGGVGIVGMSVSTAAMDDDDDTEFIN